MLLLGTAHCMFLLTCFGSKLTGGAYELICPSGCDCYSAPADGVSGGGEETPGNLLQENSAVSVICDRPEPLYSYTSFRWTAINTLVIRGSALHSPDFTPIPRAHRALSFVLEQCTVGEGLAVEPRNIFQLLSETVLRYLTVINSDLKGVDWTVLSKFDHLRAVYIERSQLATLDNTFAAIVSPHLHTISIKDSGLQYIDREAFTGKEATLQRLALTQGRLKSFVWLQTYERAWTSLWYLDLRENRITHLPPGLRLSLPNLEVFYLAGNPLKYLSPLSLEPWFSLTEFMLAAYYSNSALVQNRIFYTEEMQALKNLLTQSSPPVFDSLPAFFLESVKETLHYDCMISRNDPGASLASFGSLADCDYLIPFPHVYNYWPDNLHFNHQGQLVEGKPVNAVDNLKVVPIEGTDLNAYLRSLEQPELFIDEITNAEQYRAARETILTLLSDPVAIGNTLRLNLFGRRTFQYLAQPSPTTTAHFKAEITLWADFLEEVLGSAEEMKKYVILVVFKYEHFDFGGNGNGINFADTSAWLERKLGATLETLSERLDAQSALVGIEVASGFLRGEFTSSTNEPSAGNQCLGASLAVQLGAIHSTAALLKSKLKDTLLGVNIDASCRFCLHGAMLQSCLKTNINLASPKQYQLDFVSFSSALDKLASEVYSHRNWPANEPQFFKDLILETLTQDKGRPIRPGVFFILLDDGTGLNVLEAKAEIQTNILAAGVIVMPLKSSLSASSDLLGETIVRQKKK